ncbi:MAG: hypothetical protein E7317_04675 [Clostridiales bacterium]|nr:hypothetical protein [Clostridiales bacterium]
MRGKLLTARNLYRFLSTGIGNSYATIPMLSRTLGVTQTGFWRCFLAAGIPEPALSVYFEPRRNPPRGLSNLMNRTVPHSMPVKLYQATEEYLDPEALLHIVVWTATVIDPDLNPLSVHSAVTALEDDLYEAGADAEFIELYGFFVSMRPADQDPKAVHQKKLSAQAALRIAMLGLHALYGDRMTRSPALQRLRVCRFCDPDTLWEAVLTMAPRMEGYGFSFIRAAEQRQRYGLADPHPSVERSDADLIGEIAELAERALPTPEERAAYGDVGAGWYVVANWQDFCVNVNDSPRATYDGARELGTVPNGTLLYVLSAPGYRGLHVSGGVWGRIKWNGSVAWVPMNLLMRVRT